MLTNTERQTLASAPITALRKEAATYRRIEAGWIAYADKLKGNYVSDVADRARSEADVARSTADEIEAEIHRRGAGFRCLLCNRILTDDEVDGSLCGRCERELDDDVT